MSRTNDSWFRLAMCAVVVASMAVSNAAADTIKLAFVTVDDPGNANAGSANTTHGLSAAYGYGAVDYEYRIGKYPVTNTQYAVFLNAVAASDDTYNLWNPQMGTGTHGGITRTDDNGSLVYAPVSGRENWPVNYVTWFSALRFANWMTNNQPVGVQDSTTTESGAYTFTGAEAVTVPTPAQRAAWADGSQVYYMLPTEHEWYKAAYYDPDLVIGGTAGGYYAYGTGSNSVPTAEAPPGYVNGALSSNSANYDKVMPGSDGHPTDVGAYWGTTSPFGAFDMAGNALEWTETEAGAEGENRVRRGGAFHLNHTYSRATFRSITYPPTQEHFSIGFRLMVVPEPGTALLLSFALLSLLAVGGRRQRR